MTNEQRALREANKALRIKRVFWSPLAWFRWILQRREEL